MEGAGIEGGIERDGRRLVWTRHGEGPPLLLINGFAATGADWAPTFLAALATDFGVICPDNRGTGGSELGAETMTIAVLAADMLALLDALGVERANVVGWSMGGFVAQSLAASHPDRVDALVLLATDPGGPESVPASPAATARLYDHSGSPREQATRLIELLFPVGVAEWVDAEFGEVVAAARAGLSQATLIAQEEAMRRWHADPARSRLAAIAAPTLVMAGEEDEVIPSDNAELLAAGIAGARSETFPGAGHAFIAQAPERVAALTAGFLTHA